VAKSNLVGVDRSKIESAFGGRQHGFNEECPNNEVACGEKVTN
jgi:hypothetical protein